MICSGQTDYPVILFIAGAVGFIPNFASVLMYNKETAASKRGGGG
jgi:hypothetical protein